MSARNIRKLFGGTVLPPPDEDNSEEGDFTPLYATKVVSPFKGLVLSSNSESEQEVSQSVEEPENKPKKVHKKKKSKKTEKKTKCQSQCHTEDTNLDEIDKIVSEVNAIAGIPPPAASASSTSGPVKNFMAVSYKFLNASAELEKMLGSPEEDAKKRRQNPNRFRKGIILPCPEEMFASYKGLSMNVLRKDNGYTYYAFNHSKVYQKLHREFLYLSQRRTRRINLDSAQRSMHVDSLIEAADSMYMFEEYTNANKLIEQVICYMQYVAHHTFSVTNHRTRLEYKYIENRPFHIALLKYVYALTARACHRTALELAKVLMNLDPTDPLAVVFIIDTIAIRAREYQWLLDAVEIWTKERDAGYLFNMQYSCALAQYHICIKNKEDVAVADGLLQKAMLRFPKVFVDMLECAKVNKSARVSQCELFKNADKTSGKALMELIDLYAQLAWTRFRESGPFEWLQRNAEELAEAYDSNPHVKTRAKEYVNVRMNIFKGWPKEILRHLIIIKPMTSLILNDGRTPNVGENSPTDPVPPEESIDRCGYYTTGHTTVIAELVASLLPHHEVFVDLVNGAAAEWEVRQRNGVGAEEGPAAEVAGMAGGVAPGGAVEDAAEDAAEDAEEEDAEEDYLERDTWSDEDGIHDGAHEDEQRAHSVNAVMEALRHIIYNYQGSFGDTDEEGEDNDNGDELNAQDLQDQRDPQDPPN